ncbi:GtrA family protein [Noviherbaspirillum sp. UKPF54]|uniref:GtrA family protein n=1 Tax=Noviherbaspirillum sp. UKPF54 TaxID=2601898 RepID=UPI0011B1A164|nr:GtrA family protein [Noviherbaspirillum sp. UKPF54]QDZ28854.1 GtrA family protein [Noviherbaspirillum sp. UKPF54]
MSTFIRYIIIAILAYVIDMGGFYLLVRLSFSPILANIVVKIVAAICGFYLHRRFTYQITDSAEIMAHAKKYFGLALAYTPASSLTLFLILFAVHNPIYAKALSDILLFLVTYWITTRFTFSVRNGSKGLAKKNVVP